MESPEATGIRKVIKEQSWVGSTDIGATKMYAQATGKDESDTSGMKYDCFPRGGGRKCRVRLWTT